MRAWRVMTRTARQLIPSRRLTAPGCLRCRRCQVATQG